MQTILIGIIGIMGLGGFFLAPPLYGQLTPAQLPQGIRQMLDSQYPGWQVAELSANWRKLAEERKSTVYQLVAGDLDGNGQKDYAVHITCQGRGYVIAFLQGEEGYKAQVLRDYQRGAHDSFYLFLYRKGERGFNYATGKYFPYPRDTLELGSFKEATIFYSYEGGKFKDACITD
jgi:hypothetical protein